MKITITKNEKETEAFAGKLAKDILSKKNDKATVVALDGVLGSGKTTFTKGFAKELGIKEEITSPTFIILNEYDIDTPAFKKFYHIDCYRLKNEEDLNSIGFFDILEDSENIVLVEWAGKIKKVIPKDAVKIKFYYISENKRKISVN